MFAKIVDRAVHLIGGGDQFKYIARMMAFAITGVIALGGMITNAHSQVLVGNTAPVTVRIDPCSGQLLINTVDVPFCIAETGGVDQDKIAVYASVPPIKDGWLSSWRPTQFDITVVCIAKAQEQAFLRSAANQPSSFHVKLAPVAAVPGRACWVLQ